MKRWIMDGGYSSLKTHLFCETVTMKSAEQVKDPNRY